MWKKDGVPDPMQVVPMDYPPPRASISHTHTPSSSLATIGRSISIRGEVNGDEDLLIEGRVEGSIALKQHSVTVGRDGQVKADIVAHVVTVEGTVEGNLTAVEQVILRSSARVQGDILAPRVVLEDGARFRGGVDMGELPPATNTARPANVSREVTAAALQQVARETSTTDTASAGPRDEQRPPRDKPKSESPATASVPR